MKRMRTAASLFGVLLAILASASVLSSTAFADSKHVMFDNPVTIGGVTLQPGTYRVEWNGMGPKVQVAIMKHHDTVATASATLIEEKSSYANSPSVETNTLPEGTRVVTRIGFHKEALVFDESESSR